MMQKSNVVVRKMIIEDIDGVLDVEKKSFTTPWSKDAFISEIKKNMLADYIVAEKDNKIVGYGGVWFIVDEGHITNIATHPEVRGQGIGNVIVENIISMCREKDMERMTLEVRKSNEVAQSLYKKYGFESCGVRPKYYSDTKEDAVIMWKELK